MRDNSGGMTMTLLRLWLWVVPITMLMASVVFAVVAALNDRWALFGVMVVMGVLAVGLMVFHWWAMYRFGVREEGTGNKGPGR